MRYGVFCIAAAAAFAQTQSSGTGSERVSELASRMLERTVQARAALSKGDKDVARQHVVEALANVTAMEVARPKAPQPMMVTLYTESVQIAVKNPKPVGAGTGSANRAEVQQVTGESTRVALDVTDAKKHLTAALGAIDKGDLGAAGQDLASVDGDVKAESKVGDQPLIQARENLALALDDVRQQRFADAAAPLRAASAGLNEYSQGKSRYAKDAGKLRGEIDGMAASIEKEHAGADAKIAGWSKEITGWIQPLTPPTVK
jgi:hypothetical protein